MYGESDEPLYLSVYARGEEDDVYDAIGAHRGMYLHNRRGDRIII